MLEIYLFYATFAGQILILSVIFPRRFLRCVKAGMDKQLTPGFLQLVPNARESLDAAMRSYSRLNNVLALSGFVLLLLDFLYLQNHGWTEIHQIFLVTLVFLAQSSPFSLIARQVHKFNIVVKQKMPLQTRTADLQRRSVFNFVPPVVIYLTALSYPALVALAIYLMQKGAFPDYKSYSLIAAITFMYAVTIVTIQVKLYGKKSNPLQSPAGQKKEIGIVVRICVYTCLAGMIFIAGSILMERFSLKNYLPALACLFYILCAWLYTRDLKPANADAGGNNDHGNDGLASGRV